MKEFIAKFSSHLLGVLSGFDRVLIRGSLRGICYPKGMMPPQLRLCYTDVCRPLACLRCGEVSEWLKEHAWKACLREIATWVRIPPSPPAYLIQLHLLRDLPWDHPSSCPFPAGTLGLGFPSPCDFWKTQ